MWFLNESRRGCVHPCCPWGWKVGLGILASCTKISSGRWHCPKALEQRFGECDSQGLGCAQHPLSWAGGITREKACRFLPAFHPKLVKCSKYGALPPDIGVRRRRPEQSCAGSPPLTANAKVNFNHYVPNCMNIDLQHFSRFASFPPKNRFLRQCF